MARIAINGFGRMGRLVTRAGWDFFEGQLVHVNEAFADAELSAHLLAFDSVQGRWNDEAISGGGSSLQVLDQAMTYSQHATPAEGDWSDIDIVLECTGAHRTPETLQAYFDQGVKKVIVAAPVKKAALNMVYGVNHDRYNPEKDHILTAASCTTNCLAPVISVMLESFGIDRGCITTIHNMTNTQNVVDAPHKNARRARAAGESLIPTTTGSATAISMIYPELKGRLDGHAVRVPLLNASLTDIVLQLPQATTVEAVNDALRAASEGRLKGILGFETRPLVSVDFKGDTRSSIIDASSTMVTDGTMVKLYAWYDNEWGYVNRMVDLCRYVQELGLLK